MFVLGHFINMIFLSIINFVSNEDGRKTGKICSISDSTFIIVFMANPFTFSFFGPVLDHFLCEQLTDEAHTISLNYSLVFILLVGPSLMSYVIYLDEKSFKDVFKAGNADEQMALEEKNGIVLELVNGYNVSDEASN
jgi:hypothetical protein